MAAVHRYHGCTEPQIEAQWEWNPSGWPGLGADRKETGTTGDGGC